MRRTLFVFARADIPVVQAAVSTPLAATLRRRLISPLERNGTEPPIDGDLGSWLADLETRVEQALQRAGHRYRRAAEHRRAGAARPRSCRGRRRTARRTSRPPCSPLMSAEGRIVRGTPTGAWTSRHHRWEPVEHWWPDGLPALEQGGFTTRARPTVARPLRPRHRRGPAVVDRLEQDHRPPRPHRPRHRGGRPARRDRDRARRRRGRSAGDACSTTPVATLLPSLDPTPMGWKHRDWFLGIDRHHVFDRTATSAPHCGGTARSSAPGPSPRRRAPHRSARRPRRRRERRNPGRRGAAARTSRRSRRHPRDPHTTRALTRSAQR